MKTPTTRFDSAFERIAAYGAPVDLTRTMGMSSYGFSISVAAAEGIHVDDHKRETSRGIGMLIIERIASQNGTMGRVTNRVELYRDADGEVVANYTGRADIYNRLCPDVNYGYRDEEFDFPEQSRGIALESALVAVESALDLHEAPSTE